MTVLAFEYFQAPPEHMDELCEGEHVCSLCGQTGICFYLDFAICKELENMEKEGKLGCVDCLMNGRFEFVHDTEVGVLGENGLTQVYKHNLVPPRDFFASAMTALRRTPLFISWQQGLWLTHCNDFMVYLGTWEPEDFRSNSQSGDGRALFCEMTDKRLHHLWDSSLRGNETKLKSWWPPNSSYYVVSVYRVFSSL